MTKAKQIGRSRSHANTVWNVHERYKSFHNRRLLARRSPSIVIALWAEIFLQIWKTRLFAEVKGLNQVHDDATNDPSDESKLVSNDYPARKEERGVVTCMVDQVVLSNFSQPHPGTRSTKPQIARPKLPHECSVGVKLETGRAALALVALAILVSTTRISWWAFRAIASTKWICFVTKNKPMMTHLLKVAYKIPLLVLNLL